MVDDITGPLVPPRADAPQPAYTTNPLLQPGTPDGNALAKRRFQERRTAKQAWTDTLKTSVVGTMISNLDRVDTTAPVVQQVAEGAMAVLGQHGKWAEREWDVESERDGLLEGVPREYWSSIMDQATLEGAKMSKQKIMSELQAMERLGMDTGAAAMTGAVAGFLDLDLPLVLASGGTFTGVKAAGKAVLAANRIGRIALPSGRLAGAVSGLAAGVEAGALVGGGGALSSDVKDWKDGVAMLMTTAALSTALSVVAPKVFAPVEQIRADFYKRVREGDDSVWSETPTRNVDAPSTGAEPFKPVAIVDGEASVLPTAQAVIAEVDGARAPDVPEFRPEPLEDSVNAQRAQNVPPVFPALVDPAGRMQPNHVQIIANARQANYNIGFDAQVKAAVQTAWGKAEGTWLGRNLMNVGTMNVRRLWTTNSQVGNYMAAQIFEIPGRQVVGETVTAAILKDFYQGRLLTTIRDVPKIMQEYANSLGGQYMQAGGLKLGVKNDVAEQFNKEVMLELNGRILYGKSTTQNPHIKSAADLYDSAGKGAVGILRGIGNDIPVNGAETLTPESGYFPYKHNGDKMLKLIADKEITKDELIKTYQTSYMNAGMQDAALAKEVADAVITRMIARDTQVDESVVMLFSGDGREFLRLQLVANGMPVAQIDGIMKRFDTEMKNRSMNKNLKHRNELDLSVRIPTRSGRQISLVDMMDSNLEDTYMRYIRETAGSAALARKGLRSKVDRTEWIAAMQAEQRALGEEVADGDLIRAMFSEFDGGPQIGYTRSTGSNKGIGAIAEIKALTSLATLGLNGFAQLAETGIGIVAVGAKNWYNRGIRGYIDTAMKAKNKQVLDELAFFMGEIGNDQNIFRPHRTLDEAQEYSFQNDMANKLAKQFRSGLSTANYIQGYTSLLNTVRSHQQKIAALGLLDKVMKSVRAGEREHFASDGRYYRDFGLDADQFDRLRDLVDNGTIEFGSAASKLGQIDYVNRLNFDLWDNDLALDVSAAVYRGTSQIVQKTLAGESDRWMHTTWGAAMTQLQTFPLLAMQKQFIRNGQQMDAQAVATAMAGFGSAYAAIRLRDQFTGTERSEEEYIKSAIGYSNMLGWAPMYTDPVTTLLGWEGLRINQFGAYSKPLSVPTVDILNRLSNAPAGLRDILEGEDTWEDRQSARAIPFVRTLEAAIRVTTGKEIIGD